MSDGQGGREDNVVKLPVHDPAHDEDVLDDERLEALRLALEDLRREVRARLPDPKAPRREDEGIDLFALFDELRERVSTLGMSERSIETDEFGLDRQAMSRAAPLLDFLLERYWRVDVVGTKNLPTRSPCLFVANRSGLLPYDGAMLSHVVQRLLPEAGRPRFMVADWLITLPFVQPFLARYGGVRACRENADRLLRTGRSVVAFPEGVKGAAKSFAERYRLKRFGRGGVVRAAIENGVPLVPVGIVGAEEAHPVLFKSYLPARLLGLPFIPVTPTFPLLGPLGFLPLPTKWVVVFGEPVELPLPEDADDEELEISQCTAELRERIQALVEVGLDRRSSIWG
ncbi:MAG: acyltransferase family protein [Deltaproteobacteria bacterium]|nr:acyltransferase family protein [Deltaproteobacteria bacterium]MBW2382108.1 acyltransferase family protein [Deltaproteobacteria bacterium]